MSSESDRLLVQQIRQGDTRAWELLIARYEGRLLAFVQRRLRDRAASEDVVQESFIGFLNSLPNYDESRELQTYLFTIASYKLTDQLRRAGRHPMQHVSDGANDILHLKVDPLAPRNYCGSRRTDEGVDSHGHSAVSTKSPTASVGSTGEIPRTIRGMEPGWPELFGGS